MTNLAIIPARSGSKGLIDKNIRELNGIPLLAYSIKAAENSGYFTEIMVSTDSKKYADIAIQYGASVPFLRSEEQSNDTAGSWDVVKEVLEKYQHLGKIFDTVCLLQPTSPLRESEDIRNGYVLLDKKGANAITAVCEMDHSPKWSMVLPEDGSLNEYRKTLQNVPRQKLDKHYRINGALYIRTVSYSDKGIVIYDDNEYASIMDRTRSVDIDTIQDFELAEFYINNLKVR